MKEKLNGKLKILIVFGILFLVVAVLLTLIFLESKKSYTVIFDLDGGILLGGSLEQHVLQGQDAIPPSTAKDGAYLRGWSTSHKRITKDVVIKAIWEYETTIGITYTDGKNQNYVELQSAYKYLRGEVYLGAYYDNKKVLGILDEAFKDCEGITKVYLLNGLIKIGDSAFEGCTSLSEIAIPETVTHLGVSAFKDCSSLELLTLKEGLIYIGSGAFDGCEMLTELVIPSTVIDIGSNAFAGCKDLIIKVSVTEDDVPEGWAEDWFGDATVEYVVLPEDDGEDGTEVDDETDTEESDTDAEETGTGEDDTDINTDEANTESETEEASIDSKDATVGEE